MVKSVKSKKSSKKAKSSSSSAKNSTKQAAADSGVKDNGKVYKLGMAEWYTDMSESALKKDAKAIKSKGSTYFTSTDITTPKIQGGGKVEYMPGVLREYYRDKSKDSDQISGAHREKKQFSATDAALRSLDKRLQYIKADIDEASGKSRLEAFLSNPENFVRNAIFNTLGYPVAKAQNKISLDYLKQHPDTYRQIVYMMVGIKQNEGANALLAEEFYNRGKIPIHLKPNHNLPLEDRVPDMIRQIKSIQNKVKLVNPKARMDTATGHSSGGRNVTMLSREPDAVKYGINAGVVAVASTHYGMKVNRLGQKLIGLVHDIAEDNIGDYKTRSEIAAFSKKDVHVPVYQVGGFSDGLVPAKNVADDKAAMHFVLRGRHSTHFGTSGVRQDNNAKIADIVDLQYAQRKAA